MEGRERTALPSPIVGKVVSAAFDGGRLTSDTGVLLLAGIERQLGIAERLARCLEDPRSPERIDHTLAEMIRFRVLLIAAGYPDANTATRYAPTRRSRWRSDACPRPDGPCARNRPCAGSRTCPPPPRSSA
jgi:hypothetical protein